MSFELNYDTNEETYSISSLINEVSKINPETTASAIASALARKEYHFVAQFNQTAPHKAEIKVFSLKKEYNEKTSEEGEGKRKYKEIISAIWECPNKEISIKQMETKAHHIDDVTLPVHALTTYEDIELIPENNTVSIRKALQTTLGEVAASKFTCKQIDTISELFEVKQIHAEVQENIIIKIYKLTYKEIAFGFVIKKTNSSESRDKLISINKEILLKVITTINNINPIAKINIDDILENCEITSASAPATAILQECTYIRKYLSRSTKMNEFITQQRMK